MLSAPQGHRSVDLSKEEEVTRGHLGTSCRYQSCLAPSRFPWDSRGQSRRMGDPVPEVQLPYLSEVRTEMWQFIQHATSRGDLTHLR